MLGRQQIAGIPTAISELFKNAHDAYATLVVANYLRQQDLFVLRDNGVGMTRADFEDRWLTLGTESKLDRSKQIAPPRGMSPRPILGEKGIGRLAIAILGPHVLVITKSRRKDAPLVGAFISWELFEIPGLNLDDVDIPVTSFPGGKLPNARDVQTLVAKAIENVNRLRARMDAAINKRILSELRAFNVDPQRLGVSLRAPDLSTGHGTNFYIANANPQIATGIALDPSDDAAAPELQQTLLGFTNTMVGDQSSFKAQFWDHRTDTEVVDIIGDEEFFGPVSLRARTTISTGSFTDTGAFRGNIRVYNAAPAGLRVDSPLDGGKTRCGAFEINIGVVQPRLRESRMAPDDWAALLAKTRRIGGVYVYDDGVRVLPYGGPANDFLYVERNRSKGAAYYFFSYRRMFGIYWTYSRIQSRFEPEGGARGISPKRCIFGFH